VSPTSSSYLEDMSGVLLYTLFISLFIINGYSENYMFVVYRDIRGKGGGNVTFFRYKQTGANRCLYQ
jgi:hypothetical protein